MVKKRNILEIAMKACFFVLIFFMFSVMFRFFTRQILIEKLGWNNTFTKLVFIGDSSVNEKTAEKRINWAERYPFANEEKNTLDTRTPLQKYESLVYSLEDKIDFYTEDILLGHTYLTRFGKKYNSAIGYGMMGTENVEKVFMLNNGHLTVEEPSVAENDLQEIANSMIGFSEFLEEQGIYFVYAPAGRKVCPTDKQLPVGVDEYSNENADRLIELLNNKVNVLDYRSLIQRDFEDWYEAYYITDHHWRTTTQLWAAGVLAEHLNENAGFDFDLKYFDKDSYSIETRENYFLGYHGRTVTTAVVDLESFDVILPKFKTEFSIDIPTRPINIRGEYVETLFDYAYFEGVSEYSINDFETKGGTYDSAMWKNSDTLGRVKNHLCENNKGKRILMLQDSFGYFLSTYLAMDVAEIDFMNSYGFDGSLMTYIEETKPDVVVLLLYNGNIRPIDWDTHNSYFDFR